MNINTSKLFDKQYDSLRQNEKQRFKRCVRIFRANPNDLQLRNHRLKGKWLGYRSISIGGDLRIHYREIDQKSVLFVTLGTHSQLYK